MASVFSRIIRRELPAHIVAESQLAVAFLDISPLAAGHTLLVPKCEVDHLFDLPTDDYQHLMEFARNIGSVLPNVFACTRVGLSVVGLEVPHAHIHLVPITNANDLNFTRPKLSLGAEVLSNHAQMLRAAIREFYPHFAV